MTIATIPRSLVSAQWLANNLDAHNLVVLDATMKPVTPNASTQTPASPLRIKGARRFDFDTRICDQQTSLPHMMPTPEDFTEHMQALGINRDSAVVVYDNIGIFSSPRAWWMLRAMGHSQVAVLDGGLPAWLENDFAVEPKAADDRAMPGNFIAQPQAGFFCNADEVKKALTDTTSLVIDARSSVRFKGEEAEPRAGLKSGHMPGAVNLPFGKTQRDGLMQTPAELHTLFSEVIKTPEQSLIFSCGSGVTACINALAADLSGISRISVYDGSWSEWGLLERDFPVVVG